MAFSLSILPILLLATAASAITYLPCPCSPSSRGYREGAFNDLSTLRDKTMERMDLLREQMKTDPRITAETITNEIQRKVLTAWKSCTGNYNAEECVNADAALRLGKEGATCYPKCTSICNFDETTWKNRDAQNKVAPTCDKVDGLRSIEQSIVDGNPDVKSAVRPAPSPVSAPKPPARDSSSAAVSTAPSAKDTDASTATTTPEPGTVSPTTPVVDKPQTVNEGCVAVEHLEGYVLQHANHLRRAVLCAHGFCATPNHAIVVHGEMTSMKKLCAEKWRCVRSVKMVNNLKLAANRRAVVNEFVTVTPYDMRFPKAAVWAVQIAEDVVNLVAYAVAAGGFAVAAFLLSYKISV